MKKQTHANLKKASIEYLNTQGYITHDNNTGSYIRDYYTKEGQYKRGYVKYGKKGSADILTCSPKGRFCAFEIKIGKDKKSKAQIDYEISIYKNNGVYHTIDTIDTLIGIIERNRY